MSDSDSTDDSLGGSSRHRRHLGRIAVDPQLSLHSMGAIRPTLPETADLTELWDRADRLYQASIRRDAVASRRTIARPRGLPLEDFDDLIYRGEPSHGFSTLEATVAQPSLAQPEKQGPKKPITTLVSALPETKYKDQDDKSEKSLAYVKVQRSLLKYLATNAADTLTPLQARRWTQAIEPTTKKPKASDAMRLCYYMRSQGFDTYANIKRGLIRLFVVNQRSHVDTYDRLYWQQNFKTNFIEYTAPSNGVMGGTTRTTRRNAMAANPVLPDSYEGLLARLRGREAGPEPEHNDAAGVAAGAGAQPSIEPGEQTQDALGALMAVAEANLNSLLSGADQDPTAVEAALAEIEQIRWRTNRA